MDYEKKDFRKLYEDLVKSDWFKRAYHNKSLGECPFDIPELAESEDEKARKWIYDFIRNCPNESFEFYGGVGKKAVLAYLEKQRYDRMQPVYDNQESFESALDKAWKSYNDSGARTVDGCEDNYTECAYAKGFREGYLFGLQKQKDLDKMIVVSPEVWDKAISDAFENGKKEGEKHKEQRPAEKSPILKKLKEHLANTPREQLDAEFEALKDLTIDKPAEWSEEDEKILNELLDHCNTKNATWYNWLKSLPERFNLQPKQEWSENGEKILDSLIRLYGGEYSAKAWPWSDGVITYGDVVNFLKSLRPSWKPSDK